MPRLDHRYAHIPHLQVAAIVHRADVIDTLSLHPARQLVNPHHLRLRLLRHLHRIVKMVVVPMCQQQQIDLLRQLIVLRRRRVPLKPWIDQDGTPTRRLNMYGCVTKPRQYASTQMLLVVQLRHAIFELLSQVKMHRDSSRLNSQPRWASHISLVRCGIQADTLRKRPRFDVGLNRN